MQVLAKKLQENFGRAAGHYDARAEFQHVQTARVLDAAMMLLPEQATIADIGCGTGYFAHAAKAKRPAWKLLGIDIAAGMCGVAKIRCTTINGDAVQLPLVDASMDAAVSSLCYQWVSNQQQAFAELHRVLKPNARAIIASLGRETLHELRACASATQVPLSLLPMRAMDDVLEDIRTAGFEVSLADCRHELRYYPTVSALMDSMRAIGAGNNFTKPSIHPLSPKRWIALVKEYEQQRTVEGIPATWEHHFFVLHKPA
jgi:malonyl-CoA O-methyltransferase